MAKSKPKSNPKTEPGRVAGEKPVLMVLPSEPGPQMAPQPTRSDLQPIQMTQSAQVAPREALQDYDFKRTSYSPTGHYPVSDGLIDFGEGLSTYR